MTLIVESLRMIVTAYSLYLILTPIPGVVCPAVWRSLLVDIAKSSDAGIRRWALITITLGCLLFLTTRF